MRKKLLPEKLLSKVVGGAGGGSQSPSLPTVAYFAPTVTKPTQQP
ncbi:hypothetical protein [Pseudoalteromonas rubra]|nr:hypothetical protein [Pseudoalteromonas rubra]